MITSYRFESFRELVDSRFIKTGTILTARLDFLDETAPKDKKGVRERMGPRKFSGGPGIDNYLERIGYPKIKFKYKGSDVVFETPDESKEGRLYFHFGFPALWFPKLALDLRVEYPGVMSPMDIKELFDLDALNDYILGKN
ncbi:MAG: hypothetical protein PHF67_01405 [Candidatus Nanoarchaeia archaeon]|nr:hypothetical protein [Candidatus Nanoarchaeia archaeon]